MEGEREEEGEKIKRVEGRRERDRGEEGEIEEE